jgi:hypothetical protein
MTQQQQSNNYKTATIALIGAVITITVIAGILYYNSTLQTSGTVYTKTVNCALYADNTATQPITQINWGSMTPDSAVNVTIYIKNTGNTPCNFTITTNNWTPQNASNWISLTYDLKGAKNVAANTIIPCTLTNSISANITGVTTYSYAVTVTASG